MAAMDPVASAAPMDPVIPVAPVVPPPVLRGFDDIAGQRDQIYAAGVKGIQTMKPVANATHRIEIADVGYDDGPFEPLPQDEKKALLQQGTLHRPLKGTVRLVDQATNAPVDEQRVTLAHIPHLNRQGLFIRSGVLWGLRNQLRLRPGMYTRKKKSGEIETHVNTKPGTGRGFRILLEPESGLFKMEVGQSSTRLYPLLRAMGVDDNVIKDSWGEELYNKNYRPRGSNDSNDVTKVLQKLGPRDVNITDEELKPQALREILNRAEVDPDVTELTMGERFKNLSPERLLQATGKVLGVARGTAKEDNRDSQAYQTIHSAEDFVEERLKRDQAGAMRKLLWKAGREGKLGNIPAGLLNKNISAMFEKSGLGATLETINPFEIHDTRQGITRLGQGGIPSEESVSRDARNVQASYLGVIDPIRGPESSRLGLDLRVTDAAKKGSDNLLYTTVRNVRTGEMETVSARDLAKKVVTFPGELAKEGKRIPAVKDDQLDHVKREDVDYEIVNPGDLMSRATSMIPFPESMKGQRALMGARMTQQAMPLRGAEAPLVQTAGPNGESMHKEMAETMGAAFAPMEGVVTKVTPDAIHVSGADGSKKTIGLYNNYPLARKTSLHSTAVVQPGQYVRPGDLLAKSNFTDDKGVTAIGTNLRTAWMSAEASTLEDAVVISESAARKLTSEAMYKSDLDLTGVHSTKKDDYSAIYGPRFTAEQLGTIGDDGVIKEGSTVSPGDPMILAIANKPKRGIGAVMNSPRSAFSDKTETWEHNAPGVVTDVVRTKGGIRVTVKSYDTTHLADKLSGRFGNKGVVSKVIPDEQMPHDEQGRPMEMILNAFGITSRVNPAALAEALLGKVAQKTGIPYVMKPFSTPQGVADFALAEAEKHGVIKRDPTTGELDDTETLTDPRDGRKIPGIFTGTTYTMKLHHMAESKLSSRDQAGYTTEGLPAKGGETGSKRIGLLDSASLLSAGATEFLKDAKLVRGQRNDDYWRDLRNGETPQVPTGNASGDLFDAQLLGAGVNLKNKGTRSGLAPLLDRDVDKLAQHEITEPDTYDFETMQPVKGGLFDLAATGGADGNRFSKITLPVKIPHPLFIEPIQRILGLTGKTFEAVLSGKETIHGKTGPQAIETALKTLNVDREIAGAKEIIKSGRKTARDTAVKKLNYLTGLKKLGITADELMISKIPVIPPKYRPISQARGVDMVHDLNYLYKDLLEAKKNYTDATENFGSAGDEYLTLMNATQAISGVKDPVNPKSAEQGVKGLLRFAIGVGDSPKHATFHRKVIGTAVDTVGRGTITGDPDLDMDEVGMPADMAWSTFRPFVIRRLVRQGIHATDAVNAVKDRTGLAKKALEEEMSERPVVYNRAPSLHKFSYVGAWAKLRNNDSIGLPYHTLKGIGGDFDGDAINIHVPAGAEAVDEVKNKLMPSKNLLHPGTYESHLEPMQDYLAGLYLATRPDPKQTVHTFATVQDARKAFSRGEISLATPIKITTPQA